MPSPSEHTSDTGRQPLTLADLDKRLSVKRRTLSPDEKKTLLGQINMLLREPPNSREAAEALLAIAASATFMLFGGEWADFFQRVLGWPPAEGLRIKKLYEERRWAEVELKKADLQEAGIESNRGADVAPATSPHSQADAEKCPSETPLLADAASCREPIEASECGVTAAGEKTQPPKEKNIPNPPPTDNGDADATTAKEPVEVRLADLDRKNAIQCRAKLNRKQVKQYKARMQANDRFPPVKVFRIDGLLCITDGLHRIEAALELGLEMILCIIRDGTRIEAIKAALQANGSHGLARTNADKRHAVKLALESFPNLSHHQIADLCLVSQPFVGKVRKQLITVTSSERRMGRDGKIRRLPAKGKHQPSSEAPSEQPATDQADAGDNEVPKTGAVPKALNSSSGQDDQENPHAESNSPVVRQEVVRAVVAKIEKLILTETEGLVEAEIIAVFDAVKQVVSL